MPLIQFTMVFEQEGKGWTESLIKDGASADLTSYYAGGLALAQKRILVSGTQTRCTMLRFSQVGVFRDVYAVGQNLSGTTSKDSDTPSTTLTYNCHNTPFTKNKFIFVRGVWDESITVGGSFTPSAGYLAIINSWIAELIAGNWGWIGTLSFAEANVAGVVQEADGTFSVSLDGNLFTLPVPTFANVRISGAQGAFQINGPQIVRTQGQDAFRSKFRTAIFPWTVGGKVRYNTKGFIQIATVGFRKVGRRGPGRPLYLTPGRQRGARVHS